METAVSWEKVTLLCKNAADLTRDFIKFRGFVKPSLLFIGLFFFAVRIS